MEVSNDAWTRIQKENCLSHRLPICAALDEGLVSDRESRQQENEIAQEIATTLARIDNVSDETMSVVLGKELQRRNPDAVVIDTTDKSVPSHIGDCELRPDERARLEAMNRNLCHTVAGGRHVVAQNKYCPVAGSVLTFEPVEQLQNYYRHQRLIAGINPGKAWLQWPGKNRKLGGITFQPDSEKCPNNVLNLWSGFNVEPVMGDPVPFLGHLFSVICAKDENAYNYLIGWLAHMVQKPAEKPSVAVFMRSTQGTGKDTMVKALAAMLGRHAITLNGQRQATGRFQGVMQEKLFVFINEAQIINKQDVDALKSLITEDSVSLELKCKDPIRIPNFARFIFASNHDHILLADPKERRYLMLEPHLEYEHGTLEYQEYFNTLHRWINNGGPSALLEYLLAYDLSGFNPHAAPATRLLNEQKQLSMKPVYQFIFDWLDSGRAENEANTSVKAGVIGKEYSDWMYDNLDKKISATMAGNEIRKAFACMGIEKQSANGRYYVLPSANAIKARFAAVFKSKPEEFFS